MDFLRRLLSIAMVIVGLCVIVLFILAVVGKGNDYVQRSLDDGISATMTNAHVSRVPHGPVALEFHPGDQLYFSLDTIRPEGCFIDTDFRFARRDSDHAHTIWAVDGARVYAPAINETDHISQSVIAPDNLIPGDYLITRVTGWQCGTRTTPVMNVVLLPLRILPKGQPITQ